MEPAPFRPGEILADLHAHPGNFYGLEETLAMLSSPGLVGLTVYGSDNPDSKRILSYEQAVRFTGVTEISPGQLASITYDGSTGYFLRTQEVTGKKGRGVHILAVGFEGPYFPEFEDPRHAVEQIHRRKGLAIINHPYVTPGGITLYRHINREEEKVLEELCSLVDGIEIFNAQCINPTYGIIVPNMEKANTEAQELAADKRKKGIVASDAHFRLEQAKICGIYMNAEELCVEKIKNNIRHGKFENDHRAYVDKWSFVQGHFFPNLFPSP